MRMHKSRGQVACGYSGPVVPMQHSGISLSPMQHRGRVSSSVREASTGSPLRLSAPWEGKLQLLVFTHTGQTLSTFALRAGQGIAIPLSLAFIPEAMGPRHVCTHVNNTHSRLLLLPAVPHLWRRSGGAETSRGTVWEGFSVCLIRFLLRLLHCSPWTQY